MPGKILGENIKSSIVPFVGRLFQELICLRSNFFHGNPITIGSYIFKIARVTDNSEYDVFCKSAENWQIGHERIEQDFKSYLLHQSVPYYVTDFVRKNKKHIDELHMPLF
jgi:hypothetical protein